MMFKLVNGLASQCPLTPMFTFNNPLNNYGMRSSNSDLDLPKCRDKTSRAFSGLTDSCLFLVKISPKLSEMPTLLP